jgi:ABC-type antimicrobial peptide transport system permease subunit
MALILSAAGLYGLLSFLVSQRNREIGVRMALGARPTDVLRLVMSKGLVLTSTGLFIALLVAFGFARLLDISEYGFHFAVKRANRRVEMGIFLR